MTNKLVRDASLALLSLMLAGCGGSGSGGVQRVAAAPDTDPHGSPAWTPSPAAPGETVFPGVGVRFRPTNEVAAVAAADAINAARNTPFGHTLTGDAPTATLARATDDDFPPGTHAAHQDENVLAWVVAYRNTSPALHGRNTGTANCEFIVLVDALRATVLASFQECPAP
jgi:hypothetical protein